MFISKMFDEDWRFVALSKPQEAMLKEPALDQHLRLELETLRTFKVPKLTLFNVGISQVPPQGAYGSPISEPYIPQSVLYINLIILVVEMEPSPSKKLEKKIRRERATEPVGGRSTRIRIRSPLVLPTSRSEPKSLRVEDFRIMRVQSSSAFASTSNGDQRSQADRVPKDLEEVILSLPTPQLIDSSLKEVSAKAAGASETALAGLKLEVSALEDYKLAHELFTGMLFPADTSKLLAELCRKVRKAAVESFIWIS